MNKKTEIKETAEDTTEKITVVETPKEPEIIYHVSK